MIKIYRVTKSEGNKTMIWFAITRNVAEDDMFHEDMAESMGYQDYSLQYDYELVCKLQNADWLEFRKAIRKSSRSKRVLGG